MALQFSVAVRNAQLNAIETTVGTSPILEIRSGAAPANCAAADTGDVLATLPLPSDWLDDAASGVKEKLGTWEDTSADDDGTAGHWRIKDNGGSTCHLQGSVSGPGGGGDMEVDNTSFAAGQPFTVTAFSITRGNA